MMLLRKIWRRRKRMTADPLGDAIRKGVTEGIQNVTSEAIREAMRELHNEQSSTDNDIGSMDSSVRIN